MSDQPRNRNGDSDAYGDGMDSTGHAELAAFGRAARAVYVEEPAPEVADAHIAAILAEAERVAAAGADRAATAPARRGRVLAIRLAAVVASAFVASAGLAIAGVRPPEPVSDLFEGMGFDVPGSDQPSGDAADSSASPGTRGGEEAGGGAPAHRDASDSGDQRSAQGEDASAEGRETAEDARDGGGPPSEPGRSEDNPPADPGAHDQSEEAGPAQQSEPTGQSEQSQAGGAPPVETSSGAGEEPGTFVDPGTTTGSAPGSSAVAEHGAGPRGLVTSQEERPVEPATLPSATTAE